MKIQRSLCPHSDTMIALCFAPNVSVTYLKRLAWVGGGLRALLEYPEVSKDIPQNKKDEDGAEAPAP